MPVWEDGLDDSSIRDTPPSAETILEEQRKHDELLPTDLNQFRFYVARIHRMVDFEFILGGFCTLLMNPLQASSTYLPNSIKQFTYTEEVLMLLWCFIEANPVCYVV